MHEGNFLEQRRASAGSLTIVIALHAAALTALMLSKTEVGRGFVKTLVVTNIPDTPPPPPDPTPPKPKAEPQERQKSVVTHVKPLIPLDRPTEIALDDSPVIQPTIDLGPVGEADKPAIDLPPPPLPTPKADPVKREATLLASSQLQPPYPASEQRAGKEGSITVRIHIGADGRVTSVEKLRGNNDAFFRATEQQALRHWRFKPATVDGRPVESVKVMTVHFELAA